MCLSKWFCILIELGLGSLLLSACTLAPQQTLAPAQVISPTSTMFSITSTPTLTLRPTLTPQSTLTPSLTPTVKPSRAPKSTSTPVSTLTAHQWNPEQVLIQFSSHGGDGGNPYANVPHLVLYADGQLLVSDWIETLEGPQLQLREGHLARKEVCALLNTIDQHGFFDYDPVTYGITWEHGPFDGTSSQIIRVDAWRSKHIDLYGLWHFMEQPEQFDIEDCNSCPPTSTIPSSLRNTYQLLANYRPADLQIYEPEELTVWVNIPWGKGAGSPWPLQSPTLADLYAETRCNDPQQSKSTVLKGPGVVKIYELFGEFIPEDGLIFTEGNLRLQVYARPYLPHEAPLACGEYTFKFPLRNVPKPDFASSCSPSDGLVETTLP